MCGFVGWINNKNKIRNKRNTLKKMNETLSKRGPDSTGYYFSNNALLGHKRLAIIDIENGKQPMHFDKYTIIYNGELYNTEVIKKDLIQKGYTFDTTCDTEVLLKAYVHYKEKVLDIIEGIFAFAIYSSNEVFIARDRLGVKPLFYTKKGSNFIFASEIKAILKSDIIKPIINKKSLLELFALGPSKTPGSGIFKDIYELKPGHCLKYRKNKIKIYQYWNIKNEEFTDTFDECKNKIRNMLEGAIERQMISDVPIATLLSGGLDSSIITAVCAKKMKEKELSLSTYSIDYEDNKKYFKGNDYQVAEDNYYIDLISNKYNTIHNYKVITQRELADTLKEAMIAKDLPGMADIDSSLYWFSEQIKKEHSVVLSGECADEIFGGYPWFYKEELLKSKHFPWIRNLDERSKLLNKDIRGCLNLEKYALKQYNKTIKEIPKVKNKLEQKYRNLFYINMKWFMSTLLDRKDRMTMRTSLEVRVPFADHKLVEYLWNVPWEYKYYQNREKGLLREAFKDLLPEEVLYRKKNPYPKTHNPEYARMVSNLLKKRLKNKESAIYKIFDIDSVNNLIKTYGSEYKSPWFGQLMTGPQLIAYLYQFDLWIEEYNIILKI
ncbi:MAG: asparagine synthase (glutamine-hydrolyzing) [Ignavibacteriales bacterium]